MMQQIRHLEQKFGVGPHTISFPRIEPAVGSAAGDLRVQVGVPPDMIDIDGNADARTKFFAKVQ